MRFFLLASRYEVCSLITSHLTSQAPCLITPSPCHTLTMSHPHHVTLSPCHTLPMPHPHHATPSPCHTLTMPHPHHATPSPCHTHAHMQEAVSMQRGAVKLKKKTFGTRSREVSSAHSWSSTHTVSCSGRVQLQASGDCLHVSWYGAGV